MKNPIKLLRHLFRVKRKIEHKVVFAGKKQMICSRGLPEIPPQQFVDKNAVACGRCGDMMLPGSKFWLYVPKEKGEFDKPSVLSVDNGDNRSLVACLGWDCCPTAGLMCGKLHENREIVLFESPIQKAIKGNSLIVVEDVEAYKG